MTHIAPEGGYFVLSAYQFCRRENCMFSPERISGGSNGDISIDKSYAVLVVLLYHLLARTILLVLVRICTCMTVNDMELAKTKE